MAAIIAGNFLLLFILIALLAAILSERRRRENAQIRKFPPDETPDAAKRAKEAREESEAWRQIMNYSAEDAYGGGSG